MKSFAKKGDWVQIRQIVLEPGERSPQVPEDTKKVPLVLLVKGFLTSDAQLGDKVTITTVIGREITGELVAINPSYNHSFGPARRELINIGTELRRILKDGE
ncbi:MAG: 2-amino-4-ketopentanoate thiolase [Dehalococcoidia bacterium]|nr:MAG: 2-amino-4-ketopentanoate thiolase [Dehalococcoidia bacterium]